MAAVSEKGVIVRPDGPELCTSAADVREDISASNLQP